jgi:hypothetical protein
VNKPTDDRPDRGVGGAGVPSGDPTAVAPQRVGQIVRGQSALTTRVPGGHPSPPDAPVLAVVSDLFFVVRIRETARLAGVPIEFARAPEQIAVSLERVPRLVIVDLTGGYDYERLFASLEGARAPVLGFTTHALARQTQPWHARCDRVVTKETLTQELPRLLKEGVTA